MFHAPAEAMAYSLRASKLFLHKIIDGMKPEELLAQPLSDMNSIAWMFGHLALVDRRQLRWLGVTELPALPDGFEVKFKATGTKAVQQTNLGDPSELIAIFDAHRDALIAALAKTNPAIFHEPTEVIRPWFGDKGEASLFMGLHTMLHVGQISAIRRALGYPPLI
jgi:DinB superfamily